MIIDNLANGSGSVADRKQILRVGMAGAGWVTQYHLPAWRTQAHRAKVVAIADPAAAVLAARQEQFGVAAAFADAETMIDREKLDIIDICTPAEAHAPLVRLAADRGVAVLCQKPLAASFPEAAALVAAVGETVPVMVHDNWRFRATYRRIREWIDAGIVGDIRRVQLDYLSSGMIPDATGLRPALVRQPNFATMQRLLIGEVMIHHLDTLRFLLGDLELATARTGRSNGDIIGEDVATLILRASDGTPVLAAGNLAAHGEPPQARDQLRIFGSKATVVLDGFRLSAVGETTIAEDFDPIATYQGAYTSVIAHFLDGLETGWPFETNPVDNLKTLALVEAAYASAAVHE
jgi:predicted dehydrogenase